MRKRLLCKILPYLLTGATQGLAGEQILPGKPPNAASPVEPAEAPSSEAVGPATPELKPLPWQGLSFWQLGLSRNTPQGPEARAFTHGPLHPVLSYRYFIDQHWAMSLATQFKVLAYQGGRKTLAIASLSQETSYSIRLYHPLYGVGGVRLLYLLPTAKGTLPLTRLDQYPNELGFGLSIGLTYFFSARRSLSVHAERWRGTKTQRLQGLEWVLSFGFAP